MSAPPNLDFESAPPIGVIFGCMLPAPLLGIASGLLLAFVAPDGLTDRFSPLVLALVHMLGLGMLLPVMLGALFQMFPVLAGVEVPAARWVAPGVAFCGVATALALAAAFIGGHGLGFQLAAVLGAPLLAVPAVLLVIGGQRVVAVNATTATLRCIGAALLVVLGSGAALAFLFGYGSEIPFFPVLNLHVAWALGGWLGVLVAGVAATVWPMFWQAPVLPSPLEKIWPWLGWVPLLLASTLLLGEWVESVAWLWSLPLLLGLLGLYAMSVAKRRIDPAWPLWLAASTAWLMAGVLGLLNSRLPAEWATDWWLGVLMLVGGGVLPVNAMLGKIVPFLVWLHLKARLPRKQRAPAMQLIIRPVQQQRQAWLLLVSFALLLALPYAPEQLALPAGLVFALSQAWLAFQLFSALARFRQELKKAVVA